MEIKLIFSLEFKKERRLNQNRIKFGKNKQNKVWGKKITCK